MTRSFLRVAFLALVTQGIISISAASVLTDSEAAAWKKDLTLVEHMKVYSFPEEQISFPLELPAKVRPDSLRLLDLSTNDARLVPFQLSKDAKGKTIVCFRSDLPQGGKRLFRLVSGYPATGVAATALQSPSLEAAKGAPEAMLGNSLLTVKVPAGHIDFAGGKPLSQVPAPVLGLARRGQAPVITGSFSAPEGIAVTSMDAKVLESGPLFVTYQVAYQVTGGKSYTATLELRANEGYVRISESLSGFTPADRAFLQLNYGKGLLDPDRCLVGTNGGYFPARREPYTGGYDEHASTNWKYVPWKSTAGWWDYEAAKDDSSDPQIGYCLGFYAPNAIAVMRSTVLFRDQGSDAMVLALNRIADWKTHDRAVWTAVRLPEILHFYTRAADGAKYLTAGLSGEARYWVVGLIARDEVKIPIVPGAHSVKADAGNAGNDGEGDANAGEGGKKVDPAEQTERKMLAELGPGPEARLFNQLNDWSLDAYKDRSADWPEKLTGAPFSDPDFFAQRVQRTPANADKAKKPPVRGHEAMFSKPLTIEQFDAPIKGLVQKLSVYPEQFGAGGSVELRGMATRFGAYAVNRGHWTEAERQHARELLLFLADFAESDNNEPHHSMLGGHPNFLMDVKCTLPIAAATFPTHPRAKIWRDSFMNCYNEWIDTYTRKAVPELNTKGGRWTENISCYVGQSITGLEESQLCLKSYDGTSLGKNPRLLELIRWMRDAMMSPHDGQRMAPSQGAHSAAFTPGGQFWLTFYKFCDELAADDPQLAAEMRWMKSNGKEGSKPDIRSALYTDYGPVFHQDFAGAHESYAHMQNINGPLNYRWGHGGIVFYGAKGKAWSSNADETNGDRFDWNQVTAFSVPVDGTNEGMAATPTDQLLYDFGFAQFYRELNKADAAYRARGMMMLRDDYLVLSDEVQDAATAGTFNWVSMLDLPQVYQLKPGAPLQEKTTSDAVHAGRGQTDPGHPSTRTGKVLSYSGKGDFLTVVAPAQVSAAATPFGATVNGEYVFASQQPVQVAQDKVNFAGTYGYARPNQLALFQGERIGLNGLELRREGGDFGISAAQEGNRISGRVVGRSGGKVAIVPAAGLNPAGASVSIQGKKVASTVEKGAIVFSVDIAQRDGLKDYEIQFAK